MTTTEIRFDSKQNFKTINKVICDNFDNVNTWIGPSGLQYIQFDYKDKNILCYFAEDSVIYTNTKIIECSTLYSDRPNDIKTEAFLIIANHFDCTFWENDWYENDFKVFKSKTTVNPNTKTKITKEQLLGFGFEKNSLSHISGSEEHKEKILCSKIPQYTEAFIYFYADDLSVFYFGDNKDLEFFTVTTTSIEQVEAFFKMMGANN